MSFCVECGKPLREGAKFCAHCGKPAVLGAATERPFAFSTASSGPPSAILTVNPTVRAEIASTLFVVGYGLMNDFQAMLQKHRLSPLGLASGPDVDVLRQRTRSECARHGSRLKQLCIIGNWEAVPPYEIVHDFDGESSFSDAPYAGAPVESDHDPLAYIPQVLVSRIPTSNMAVAERVLFRPLPSRTASEAFYLSVTAEKWRKASEAILQATLLQGQSVGTSYGDDDAHPHQPFMMLSPDWDEDSLSQWMSDHPLTPGSLLHFNVHGGPDTPQWVGEGQWGGYQSIFSPATVSDFASAILFTEACFGGAMGYDEPSVVENFFEQGGHAFVGCSVPAYGDPGVKIFDVPTFAADTLALAFFKRLQEGMKLGAAFLAAKMAVLADDPPMCQAYSVKTVCSFNLYGAPWHALPKDARASIVPRPIPSTGSALDRIRSRMNVTPDSTDEDDDISLLQRIRETYRARIRVPLSQRALPHESSIDMMQGWMRDPEISGFLQQMQVQPRDLHLHRIEYSDQSGYLLRGKPSQDPRQTWVLVLNEQGHLQQVIATKSGA
jgi:hypothetical protein